MNHIETTIALLLVLTGVTLSIAAWSRELNRHAEQNFGEEAGLSWWQGFQDADLAKMTFLEF